MSQGWKIVFLVLFFFTWSWNSANAQSNQSDNCVFLGGNPSFIIKFKNHYASVAHPLTKAALQQLSVDGVTFTTARPMSGGAYIVFFKPTKFSVLQQVNPGCYTAESIQHLKNRIETKNPVEYIDPNVLSEPLSLPSRHIIGPVTPVQWDLLSTPGGMEVESAWNITSGSSNAITAVLDTGYLTNEDLSPNIAGMVSFTDNGSVSTGATPSCGSECRGHDHGTHVSGTVSASGELAYGQTIFGVAPTAKVLAVNVFTKFTDAVSCRGFPPCLRALTADQVNALNWLAGTHYDEIPDAPYVVDINMSLGGIGTCPVSQQDAFNVLLEKNISIAIAAGNDNIDVSRSSPANCDGVFAIAATNRNAQGAFYSNYGALITVAAPGGSLRGDPTGGIYSTVEDGYAYMQGTSMASPHVAGLIALLYSADPTLTPTTTLNLLTSTAMPFSTGGSGNSCTPSRPCGAGIVNAASAVQQAQSAAPTLNWTPNVAITHISPSQVMLTWDAAAWSVSRETPITYTTHVEGSTAPLNCTDTLETQCDFMGLALYTNYTAYVTATDIRQLYTPLTSSTLSFSTYPSLNTPVISGVTRNPLQKTQAFIYYSNSGFIYPSYTYVLHGLTGASIQSDEKNKRFIINNIKQLHKVNNVSISIDNNDPLGNQHVQTASFTIPSILGAKNE